jgi:hypothetical protein
MTSGGANMKGTIYGNWLSRGTQVKKGLGTAAVHWYLPDYSDLSLKHVGESTLVCNLYIYYVYMLVYRHEYKYKTQDE